ncbi:MAG: hypothetical protein BMS9Abin04_177 [Planctomycetia bacterium]|nr:MAG: hypothetical protein BMS9Abin04_177 [Planctomycetia bacterium]
MAIKKASRHRGGDNWTFLSNHAHVLLAISGDPELRLRDVAEKVGITERAVQGIVADLVDAGYLTRVRSGRRNRYQVHTQHVLRHAMLSHQNVTGLLALASDPHRSGEKPAETKKRPQTPRRKRTAPTTRAKAREPRP